MKTTELKTAADKGAKGQAPPHRRGHRRAGPNAAVLLHPNRPPDGMTNTESEATLACAGTTNPPLSTPHSHARGPPNPPHGSTLRTRLQDCRQSSTKRCPAPCNRNKPQITAMVHIISLLPPRASRRHRARRPKMSPAPSSDVVPHREVSAKLRSPAAVRCRPSPLRLPLPQAPSFNAVPHRTGDCQATPGAVERCERSKTTAERRPPGASKRADVVA
jgi:hypothetical protein